MLSTLISKRFIAAFLKLTRTGNLFIIALAQYFTAWFLVGEYTIKDPRLFLLSVSTILIAAAGYIINDYFDIKIDLINKPDRVIVGKSIITRRYAIFFHVALSFIGILMGTYLSLLIGVINLFSVSLLWFYSSNFKRQPFIGNLTVAFLTGMSVYIIEILYPPHHALIVIYAVFAFFMTLVREIIKDMEDLKGDHTFGCRTLPIIWGLRRTKIFVYFIIVIFLAIAFLVNQRYTQIYFYYFAGLLLLPLIMLIIGLARADMKRDFYLLSTFCKVIMLLGIMSMALL
jgi:4-hydroxybenzoate polyprenyltransferase